MNRKYSTRSRRDYIEQNQDRYRHDEKSGYSLRDIAWDVKQAFDLDKPPSASTITSDLRILEERKEEHIIGDEATRLMDPDLFPEWRATLFRDAQGKPYETPPHQFAWFHLIRCLALKQPLPDWVIEWFRDHSDADLSEINDWVENPQLLLTLWLLAPPRAGKTDCFRHACIWLMIDNPNIRIFWQSITLPISKLTSSWLKRELASNEKLINMYGPFVTDGSWSDKEFTIATRTINLASSTFLALGKNEGTQSRDADLIVVDDFIDENSSRSIIQVDQDVSRLKSQVLTRREPWTPVLGIGSHERAPHGDAYDYMERHEQESFVEGATAKTLFIKVKAHDYARCKPGDLPPEEKHGEWCILWPTVRDLWFLEAQRHDLGDTLYEVRYNQESRRSAIIFFREEVLRGKYQQPTFDPDLGRYSDPDFTDPSDLPGILDFERSYGELPDCCNRSKGRLLIAMGFDPAAGESRWAAESSLHVLAGCRFCLRRYVYEEWSDRVSPERNPDIIDAYAARTRPQRVRVEINAYQKALARDPRLRKSAAARRYLIEDWRTDERRDDPEIGVPNLHSHMEAGKFSLPYKTPMDQQRSNEHLRQMTRWPQKPNDKMMSLWLADLSVAQLIEQSQYEKPYYLPGFEDMSDHLRDSVWTLDLSEVRA